MRVSILCSISPFLLVILQHAMETVGITKEEQECIFRILAGLLHLGNVKFIADEKNENWTGAKIVDRECMFILFYFLVKVKLIHFVSAEIRFFIIES
jgi:myosin heavy subunit